MRISDWSSDVCSSDLCAFRDARVIIAIGNHGITFELVARGCRVVENRAAGGVATKQRALRTFQHLHGAEIIGRDARTHGGRGNLGKIADDGCGAVACQCRSEEHTSELQSLMRISYAVFCLKKKKKKD